MHLIDCTIARAHRSARGAKGGANTQAIGRSHGSRSTAIHAVFDGCVRPVALELTSRQTDGAPVAALMTLRPPPARRCAADTACASNALRARRLARRTERVIPGDPTRKRLHLFYPEVYALRNLIERMFAHLKDWGGGSPPAA